jgi:hypothetical protein
MSKCKAVLNSQKIKSLKIAPIASKVKDKEIKKEKRKD